MTNEEQTRAIEDLTRVVLAVGQVTGVVLRTLDARGAPLAPLEALSLAAAQLEGCRFVPPKELPVPLPIHYSMVNGRMPR